VYQWIGGDRPADVGDAAREKVDAGFTALKMNATAEMRPIDTLRPLWLTRWTGSRPFGESVGDEVDIGVDFHGRVSKPMVRRLAAALEPYDPMFIEEPVLPEHNDALPAIRQSTTTPIATGERMYSRWDFKEVFETDAVDLIQPDVSRTQAGSPS